MHLSGLIRARQSTRKDDLRVVSQLTDTTKLLVLGGIRQSTLECIGRVVKAGVLVDRDGAAPLEHNQCLLDNHACGLFYIQAGILDEASFSFVSIVQHHRSSKFLAVRECENIGAPN